jgi:predicted O-methyltransferase YrrM
LLLIKNKKLRQLCGVLETANWLFLKLLFRRPSAARLFPGVVYRDYVSLVGRERWPSKSIFELCPELGQARAILEHLPGEGIATSISELAQLALLTRYVQPKAVFEIGTFRGRTALNFALNSPDDCVVYTLDLSPDERAAAHDLGAADSAISERAVVGCDYQGRDVSPKIRQLYGDSQKFDFGPYADAIDLVFVDGAHHYAAVESDTRNALRMARSGGWIVWHDFANYGDYNDVTRAILDLLSADQIVQLENTQLAVFQKPAGMHNVD